MTRGRVSFDRLAGPYLWLERLTFGRALERCRLFYLPRLTSRRQALVLGDGDGRFLARLLAQNPDLRADAVDLSPAMLHLLQRRSISASPTADLRLQIHPQDALSFMPVEPPDLVVTHFFLDCLTGPEVDLLASRLAPTLAPGAVWLVSDFRIPPGPLRLPARLLVRLLYFGFRVLTGLRTTQLPDHARSLTAAGLERIALHISLFGLLFTELWQIPRGSL